MHDDDDGDSDVYELLFKKTCVREVGSSIQRLGSCIYVYIYIYIREREREIPLGSMLPPNISIAASTYFEYVKYSKHMNYNRADTIYLCILVLYFLNQEKYNKYIGSIKSGRSY